MARKSTSRRARRDAAVAPLYGLEDALQPAKEMQAALDALFTDSDFDASALSDEDKAKYDALVIQFNAYDFEQFDGVTDDAASELEGLQEEIDNWKDNMPESLQQGEKYQQLEECSDALSEAVSTLQGISWPSAPATLQDLQDWLDEAETGVEEAQSAASEAENAEFPGMY